MTVEENVRKLGEFCNNLGKGFRMLTEDTNNKFKKFDGQVKSLQEKNNILEDMYSQADNGRR